MIDSIILNGFVFLEFYVFILTENDFNEMDTGDSAEQVVSNVKLYKS